MMKLLSNRAWFDYFNVFFTSGRDVSYINVFCFGIELSQGTLSMLMAYN